MFSNTEELQTVLDQVHNECLMELNGDISEKSGTLFHYTNMQGAASLIENGKFWFTDVRYCNDPNEIDDGLKLLNEVHAEIMDEYLKKSPAFTSIMTHLVHLLSISLSFDNLDEKLLARAKEDLQKCGINPDKFSTPKTSIFIACFSERHDDLRQWMPYADDGKGAALYFRNVNEVHHLTPEDDIGILKVCYQPEEKKKQYIRNFYAKALEVFSKIEGNEPFINVLLANLYHSMTYDLIACKSENYKDEQEWRLVLLGERQAMDKRVKFRVSNNVVRPYIEVPVSKESVLGLLLGPKTEATLNQHAFETMFRKHDYPNAKVRRSLVAYR